MSKSPYGFTSVRNKPTPQSRAIPGREEEMTQNLAGGYSFKASDWQVLRRWLLTGSMFDAYYQGKEQMTSKNAEVLKKVMNEDASRVAQEILDASKKGVSVHTPIYALAILSTGEGAAKNAFREIFSEVIRTGSQLYEFLNYTKGLRGFGSLIHKTIKDWFAKKDAKELEYQFLKYQSRYDWSGRDVLRMIKPIPQDGDVKAVYNWIAGGSKKNPLFSEWPAALERINAYEKLKKGASENDIVDAINKYRMTWEMMPGNLTQTKKTWEALFRNMPVGATIRNLGNLTDKKIFSDSENLDTLEERLTGERLKKAHIHPVVFASALKIYKEGGNIGKSKLTWTPVNRVVDTMENGIEACFDSVEPTGKHFFYALDVSGSMIGGNVGTMWMSPLEVQGVMAVASVRSEKDYFVGGFDTNFTPLVGFNKKTSYGDVMLTNDYWNPRPNSIWPGGFGGTDANAAYRYAIDKRVKTDVFVFMTDSESWAGYQHPAQGLKEYRNRVNKDVKAIYVTLIPYSDNITLADPKDPMSFDIAGFTGQTPKIINLIAKGDL